MNTFLFLFLAFILAVVTPTVLVFALKKHPKALKIVTIVFACVYFICLFIGTTAKLKISADKVTVAFNFTEPWFSIDFLFLDFSLKNMFVNLAMMFPLGFIVYVFTDKKQFVKTVIFALSLSLFIELYQFILPIYRNTEITDIIYNVLSGVVSAVFCQILKMYGAFSHHNLSNNKKESLE